MVSKLYLKHKLSILNSEVDNYTYNYTYDEIEKAYFDICEDRIKKLLSMQRKTAKNPKMENTKQYFFNLKEW